MPVRTHHLNPAQTPLRELLGLALAENDQALNGSENAREDAVSGYERFASVARFPLFLAAGL